MPRVLHMHLWRTLHHVPNRLTIRCDATNCVCTSVAALCRPQCHAVSSLLSFASSPIFPFLFFSLSPLLRKRSRESASRLGFPASRVHEEGRNTILVNARREGIERRRNSFLTDFKQDFALWWASLRRVTAGKYRGDFVDR